MSTDRDCLFCRMAAGMISVNEVYQDDHVLAFHDINPQAPTHVLVVPRKPVVNVAEATDEDAELLGRVMLGAGEVARQLGLVDGGYRLVVNNGAGVGQTVFHLHVHVLAGRPFTWPPG